MMPLTKEIVGSIPLLTNINIFDHKLFLINECEKKKVCQCVIKVTWKCSLCPVGWEKRSTHWDKICATTFCNILVSMVYEHIQLECLALIVRFTVLC